MADVGAKDYDLCVTLRRSGAAILHDRAEKSA